MAQSIPPEQVRVEVLVSGPPGAEEVGIVVPSFHPCYKLLAPKPGGREFHVAVNGDDNAQGQASSPLRTISEAARRARPGDVVTVRAGTYRETIDPPRSGASETERIVFQAAQSQRVEIRGSEVVKGWVALGRGVWMLDWSAKGSGGNDPFEPILAGDWLDPKGRTHHLASLFVNDRELPEQFWVETARDPVGPEGWFVEQRANGSRVLAKFVNIDPNEAKVEVTVRRAVFYPSRPGMNYIAVRGFILAQAANPWGPPTAEQIGLIGTHWSRGWLIEHNEIRHARCAGLTLGKYGDEFDNTSANAAEGYVQTVRRALARGWKRNSVGHHTVRYNHIHHCEQAGIIGSMGAAFSEVYANVIHDIHQFRTFGGAEQAGIKFHGAIDTRIRQNRVFRSHYGIWLDWMAQNTRVSGNLLHDNDNYDIYLEVNHGPLLVDNNVLLSARGMMDWSEGSSHVHNLINGAIWKQPEMRRETPFHVPHDTAIADIRPIEGGDDRLYHNLVFDAAGLTEYSRMPRASVLVGNVVLAQPLQIERVKPAPEIGPLKITACLAADELQHPRARVDSDLLGPAELTNQRVENPDGTPLTIDHDFFLAPRPKSNVAPGPFQELRPVK